VENKLLFATRRYAGLGRDVAALGAFETGQVEVEAWKDGEIYQRVETPARGRDVVLIAGTDSETNTLETFDLAFALVEQGARSLTLAVPFFGYSTMERAWMSGDAVTAKSRARVWSSLPRAPLGNRILILEPHTQGLPHYFGDGPLVSGIDASPLMLEMLAGFAAEGSVLCSPDTGRIKWVDALALQSGRGSAFVLKRRGADGSVAALGLTGAVKDRAVVLCDDMIRTGGTLVNAARACLEAGASGVAAAAIHGAFTPGTHDMLASSGLFTSLICTDSHPNAYDPHGSKGREPAWLQVKSCAALLAAALA
jgi:ribose-phosphate pyrophosphokinase